MFEIAQKQKIDATMLGSATFCKAYNIKYAYVAGAMYKGISSIDLVIAMGKAGLIGFLGTGGLTLTKIESAIQAIQQTLDQGQSYGMNLIHNPVNPMQEYHTVKLFLKYQVNKIEAAAYTQVTQALLLYRLKGLRRTNGLVVAPNRVIAKVSRFEVAESFMRPAPPRLIAKLREAGEITEQEAQLAHLIPVASEICVEADSGGHTDQGVASVLLPTIIYLRKRMVAEHQYQSDICVGLAGGIGTPESAAAAYILGADFILTGSINQCTVEAGTSNEAKDLLQQINIQDTAIAPAGDLFESGAKVQVMRKGSLFAARANKLFELYSRFNALDEIDAKTLEQIQSRYFRRNFDEVWQETCEYYNRVDPTVLLRAEENSKQKMALIFRWYFVHANRLAMNGDANQVADYQIQCGPALGAFNQWVKGTALESWRNRSCPAIAEKLIQETASLLGERYNHIM